LVEIDPSFEPKIAGIILAAGESRRLGTPKQLLPWRGEPLIKHVVRLAQKCHLNPVIVVSGYQWFEVSMGYNGLPTVLNIVNPDWMEGQSTSIRSGLGFLEKDVDACLFFMSDQPQIPVRLVKKIVKRYIEDRPMIVAPRVEGKRGNPVLFDCRTFKSLRKLEGNEGGRKLFDRYPVTFVEWKDASILLDVDTMEDYQKLKELES
jgi:molybdenum cofactor cytidylyltransferase